MENIYFLARSIKELLLNLSQRCTALAELYQTSEEKEGNTRFIYFIEDINTLSEAVSHIHSVYPEISIDELNSKLALVLEQMENQDFLYVADLLKFELQPLLEFWSGTIIDG
ncbi:hypothetical protein T458_06390 [Brevibacillus panacihumi W25]|uniref:Uncharacterized protein n=1 Tax=Brevibacillus panacihumi W25 TaxID=1408254 RepID=V6MCP4_9BACL|nr:hypothetical protein [Brevibacillus panacihumi]EST55665.1 hypothetical protein T458_06390 [Brevibacillus panacihumi W25]